MKVLQLSYEPIWRGAEQQMAFLVEGLKEKGIECVVACRKDSPFEDYCQRTNVPYFSLSFANELDLVSAYRIASFCKKNQVDVIHTHSGHALAMGVWANILGAKSHHIYSRRVLYPVKDNMASRFKFNHSSIRRIACVSEAVKQVMQEGNKVPERCVTLHSGIDLKRFPEGLTGQAFRKEFNISSDELVVTNISALSAEKDCLTYVRAVKQAKELGVRAKFFLVGEGSERESIELLVEELGLQGELILTGHRTDIPEILSTTDIFMMTSRVEGLGSSILDAFANELPVIATRSGGIPEMVKHEATGLLASVGDVDILANSIKTLASDEELRKRYGRNGRALLEKEFTKEVMVENTIKLYQEVLEEFSGRSQ